MAVYKVCKGSTGKSKKEVVAGVKKVIYSKTGSTKKYVKSKGRMIGLTLYKKAKAAKKAAVPKKKRVKRHITKGGENNDLLTNMLGGMFEEIENDVVGGKGKRSTRRRSKRSTSGRTKRSTPRRYKKT